MKWLAASKTKFMLGSRHFFLFLLVLIKPLRLIIGYKCDRVKELKCDIKQLNTTP
jgi:hypothetical protein